MIRAGLAVLAALCLASCGARDTPQPKPAPALWEVTGPHGEHAWLFGTIHALPAGTKWETDALDQALRQADALVVEVANLSDTSAGSQAFAEASQSPGLPPLLQRIPAADRPALTAALARAGLHEGDFAQMETWAAALTIANAQEPGNSENGVDRALLARGLPVIGLEGFAEQFAIFDQLPPQDQADLLRLAAAESAPDEDRAMTRAWLRGDLNTLDGEASDGVLADPELRQVLLIDRDRAWLGRIVALLDQRKRPFVAVGAAHMLEDVGLPALLAARGYTVRRIQ
jgi:uncharacterized protein YbaP (TraB family)